MLVHKWCQFFRARGQAKLWRAHLLPSNDLKVSKDGGGAFPRQSLGLGEKNRSRCLLEEMYKLVKYFSESSRALGLFFTRLNLSLLLFSEEKICFHIPWSVNPTQWTKISTRGILKSVKLFIYKWESSWDRISDLPQKIWYIRAGHLIIFAWHQYFLGDLRRSFG